MQIAEERNLPWVQRAATDVTVYHGRFPVARDRILILAIRTARWPRIVVDTASQPEWDAEVEQSVKMAHRILSHLLAKSPFLFQRKDVPCYQPSEEESPR